MSSGRTALKAEGRPLYRWEEGEGEEEQHCDTPMFHRAVFFNPQALATASR